MATSWLLGLAAPVPAPADFWVRDQPGRITHACTGTEPLVMCLQGRKVVMQVQADHTNGFSYRARFFNLPGNVEQKKVLFKAGRESGPEVRVNNQPLKSGFPAAVTFDGMLTLTYPAAKGMIITRTVYPSMAKALVIEEWQVRNTTRQQVTVTVAPARKVNLVEDNLAIVWSCPRVTAAAVKAGGVLSFSTCVQAKLAAKPDLAVDVAAEHAARRALADAAWSGPGRLETPEPALDVAFALQKLHVLETPIETIKGVITHNGSLTYSPGIWANDPVEYSSPLFPFFGDAELNRASMNMYRVWQDYCQKKGIVPFPGSFEGPALKLTQRERGDDAMVLYGLSKFLLFQGDRAAAEELWPLIEFSAASVLRHTTAEGIIASQTDEMEDRYPTGTANLSTSSLAYGGYRLAARLAQALGKPVAAEFDQRAGALRKSLEAYFGAEVGGFKTYRYYKGNTTLRGWILLPLAMGITERQEATVVALMSDKLWPHRLAGADILAESTRRTEWGRETYYALRVLFKAGRTEDALDLTRRVVKAQIFGSKGPYPDEDAIDMLCPGSLYPRVFTEGMFGIVPTGLDSFECTPWLPKAWPRMALRDVRAFGRAWNLLVERVGDQQKVTVSSGGKTVMTGSGPAGKTYSVTFPNRIPTAPPPKPAGFLGLTFQPGGGESLAEGKTDYTVALRPAGTIRAVMLFAKFPDATREEPVEELYNHLGPKGISYMDRASYGKVKLIIDPILRWIPMEHPSTWKNYDQSTFEGHRTYIQEVAQKVATRVDFSKYDITYIVSAYSPGCPISPTFGASTKDAPKINGALIRHAVTFGNDCRGPNWGWQTLAHETGHIFGLPDLYSFDKPTGRYKDSIRHVGAWDLMSYQAIGQEYFAWHKLKLEWLNDNDFWIATPGDSTVTVVPIYEKKGVRGLVVPVNTSEAYVMEVRARDANPQSECGVLVYYVDLKRPSGHGPIKVLPAAPDSGDPDLERTYITLYNALHSSGTVINDSSAHLKVEIVGRDGKGYKFRVSR